MPPVLGAHRSHVHVMAAGADAGAGDSATATVPITGDAWRHALHHWIHPLQHTDRSQRAATFIQFIITWAQQQAQTQTQTQTETFTETLTAQAGPITTINQLKDEQPPTGGQSCSCYVMPCSCHVGCSARCSCWNDGMSCV